MTSNLTNGYFSADGHVVEPADLFTTRMDTRFRDRAPRVESLPDNDFYIVEGCTPLPAGFDGGMIDDKVAGKIESMMGRRHTDTRPGAWDPTARLVDQDLDHLRAEVLYPGFFGLQFFSVLDPEYQQECMRVYNDWLSEFCAASPKRLFGAALLPTRGSLKDAIAEAERIAKKGLSSLMIPAESPERPYSSSEYEPLWAALQDLGLPLAAHSGTGTGESIFARVQRLGGIGMGVTDNKIFMPQRALAELIWAAVPERYPRLRFVIVEGGIGWIASLLRFMDHWWTDHHHWMEPKLNEPPSTYFRRQFWATFEDDRAGILTRELMGVDRLMWGADYPHTEGVWPHSREQISKDFAGVPEGEVYQMVVDNAARLYGAA